VIPIAKRSKKETRVFHGVGFLLCINTSYIQRDETKVFILISYTWVFGM
jgi:hypothetical protein